MATLTFKGGVHPYDGKELSKDKAIVPYEPKGDMIYPVSQHIGAPAVPVVEKGEQVKAGQCIARPGDGLSVAIHSSVDGIVQEVTAQYIVVRRTAEM